MREGTVTIQTHMRLLLGRGGAPGGEGKKSKKLKYNAAQVIFSLRYQYRQLLTYAQTAGEMRQARYECLDYSESLVS